MKSLRHAVQSGAYTATDAEELLSRCGVAKDGLFQKGGCSATFARDFLTVFMNSASPEARNDSRLKFSTLPIFRKSL